MREYDVLIVGAGPAGCQCARELARRGRAVLLIDRCRDFDDNNFSSAGTTLESLSEFGLPEEVVGAYWNKVTLVSTRKAHTWEAPERLGAVLDFAKLRRFLSQEARRLGAEVQMGFSFQDYRKDHNGLVVLLENSLDKQTLSCRVKVIVDATGFRRCVMGRFSPPKKDYIHCLGVEYLVQADQQYRPDELVFLVGHKWMRRGYSWVFPMGQGRLKVGAGRVLPELANGSRSLKYHAELVLKDYLQLREYEVLDLHGGPMVYSRAQTDDFHVGGIVAIGDAISAFNPLGGEGIRHGMRSANLAAQHIHRNLSSQEIDFSGYEREMREYFGRKWTVSLKISELFYGRLQDSAIDKVVQLASRLSVSGMMDVLFRYEFKKSFGPFWELFSG